MADLPFRANLEKYSAPVQAALKKHFPIFPDERYDRRSGPSGLSVGFHSGYGDEQALRVEAAHISNLSGRSYASAYKIIKDHRLDRPGPRRRDIILSRRGKEARNSIFEAVATDRDHLENRLDYFLIDHTALACAHNLDCAEYLSNLGYLSEAAAVIRQALEKVALLAEIHTKRRSFEFRDGMKSVWNIKYLKEDFSSAGNFYSLLSAYAHWSPAIHFDVLADMDEHIGVMKASSPFKVTSLILLSTCQLMAIRTVRRCLEPMLLDPDHDKRMAAAEAGLTRSTISSIKSLYSAKSQPTLWDKAAVMFLQAAGRI